MKIVDQRTSDQLNRIMYPSSMAESSAEASALLLLTEIAYDSRAIKKVILGNERRRAGREAGTISVHHADFPSPIRSSLADFLRKFTTASLPVSVLPTSTMVTAAKNLSNALDVLRNCSHVTGRVGTEVCKSCTYSLAITSASMESLLPTTTIFIANICEARSSNTPAPFWDIAQSVSILLRSAITVRDAYSFRFPTKQTFAAQQYSTQFEHLVQVELPEFGIGCNLDHNQRDESGLLPIAASSASRSGEIHPGRPLVRPRIQFTSSSGRDGWSEECSKNYRHGLNHSPGLFTVQCTCSHPKLLVISVMSSSESVPTALTAVLSRFPTFPRVAFYDNACNLARSISLRFPWVAEKMRVLCDRFHYRSHKCGPEFDPDSYSDCNRFLTSGAECLNRQWSSSRNNIRFLSGDNLIPFLYARAVFINFRAHLRDEKNTQDIEDENVVEIGSRLMPCQCTRCL